ncbi:Nodulation protein A [Ensifer psoraleae]|uniref:hypothetical protein n=1 Tax=Sinorhizobium psoraleae TaxID=520838 RepID=UPI00249DEE14|nr:hypothetical protein [Sinorhizobium psoraleae]NRP75885.1 Nodulation protein A [Sinorhizobium psoraleae]
MRSTARCRLYWEHEVQLAGHDVNLDLPPTPLEDTLVVVFPPERPMSECPSRILIDWKGPAL